MPFKILRNDITKMKTEAIVNTANAHPAVGAGCDRAVYTAAGYDELLAYRTENIGYAAEGDVFMTPGFRLPTKYIIHAVSPLYVDGKQREEEKLRSCYRKSLALAAEHGIKSIAIPLIATGSFEYPKEEGMRIAVDEIHAFLLKHEMEIVLVVFDEKTAGLGRNLYPELEEYIDSNYVRSREEEEYGSGDSMPHEEPFLHSRYIREYRSTPQDSIRPERTGGRRALPAGMIQPELEQFNKPTDIPQPNMSQPAMLRQPAPQKPEKKLRRFGKQKKVEELCTLREENAIEALEKNLAERMQHISDTFPQYLLYLIREKGMENAEVYKRAIVDKKVFSKIKNNPDYHPQKITALCLCVGAKLNLDEAKDLLARAGYALSPCDKTDIIFSYFIENEIYDMIELDIQLEEHGLPCIIS